jgi:C4-dicarboxylate transporter
MKHARRHTESANQHLENTDGQRHWALAAIASLVIILLGLPELWYFLPGSMLLGCVIALVIHFIRHRNPGESCILPAMKK